MSKPSLSVICATYKGAEKLPGLIKCLSTNLEKAQDFVEVIFVIDGSEDSSSAIIKKFAKDFPSTRIVCERNKSNLGASASRNIGVSLADSEIIAFVDDDCRPTPTWMLDLISIWKVALKQTLGLGGVVNSFDPITFNQKYCQASTPLRPYRLKGGKENVLKRLFSYYSQSINQKAHAEYFAGCNMTFRRSAFVKVGGFDPSMKWGGEDAFICSQIRRKFGPKSLVIDPELIMPHEYSLKLSGSLWRSYAYGRSSGRNSRITGSAPSFNPGPSLILLLGLVFIATSAVLYRDFLSLQNILLTVFFEISLYVIFLNYRKIIICRSTVSKFLFSLIFLFCETANTFGFLVGILNFKKELVYRRA